MNGQKIVVKNNLIPSFFGCIVICVFLCVGCWAFMAYMSTIIEIAG